MAASQEGQSTTSVSRRSAARAPLKLLEPIRSTTATSRAIEDIMKRLLLIVIVLGAFAAVPAAGQVNVTVGAGGIYPAGTTFSGVTINGLQSGYGIENSSIGSALGQFWPGPLGL